MGILPISEDTDEMLHYNGIPSGYTLFAKSQSTFRERNTTFLEIVTCDPLVYTMYNYLGLDARTCLWGFANNTGAEQPAHPGSLITAFVIRFWKVLYVTCYR